MSVVWECGACGTRSLERRCEECGLFCSKVGAGAECPACSELIAIAELMASAGSGGDVPTDLIIGVDELDAVGLAGVLDYIAEWLTDAPPAVTASLGDHGGGPGASEVLLAALAHHSRALTTVSTVTPGGRRSPRRWPRTSRRCCAGCACPTSAAMPPK